MSLSSRRDALVLVDFDNVYYGLSSKPSFNWITVELNDILNAVFQADPEATGVRIRYYGGWVQEGLLSRKGALLEQALAAGPRFPLVGPRKTIVNGDIELAMTLLSVPDVIWFTFLKEHPGMPRFRAKPAVDECAARHPACPMKAIQLLSQAKTGPCAVPTCSLTRESCFFTHEQKLVDSFMTCDVWFASVSKAYRSVHVFSGDVDHLPGVLQGAMLAPEVKYYYHTTLSEHRLALYEAALKRAGVEAQAWSQK